MPRKKSTTADSPQQLVPEDDRAGKQAAFVSEDYNKVARLAKLEGLLLTASQFVLKPSYFSERRKEGRVRYVYGTDVKAETYDASAGNASCVWNWSTEAMVGKTKLLSISASYMIIYVGIEDCNEEAVKRFLKRVGRFATYPYFRAHVSQISWESSANLPLMPTIAT